MPLFFHVKPNSLTNKWSCLENRQSSVFTLLALRHDAVSHFFILVSISSIVYYSPPVSLAHLTLKLSLSKALVIRDWRNSVIVDVP